MRGSQLRLAVTIWFLSVIGTMASGIILAFLGTNAEFSLLQFFVAAVAAFSTISSEVVHFIGATAADCYHDSYYYCEQVGTGITLMVAFEQPMLVAMLAGADTRATNCICDAHSG